jgi:hypothetical protein
MRWTGRVASMGEMRNAHRILVGEPEGRIQLAKSRRIILKCNSASWSFKEQQG